MELKLFINGKFIESSEKKVFQTYNPATGEIVAKCHLPTSQDINSAVTAAKKHLQVISGVKCLQVNEQKFYLI